MSDGFYEVVIQQAVKLPSTSTTQPERDYESLSFLSEWVLQAKGMRADDNLPHLFEWEEAIAKLTTRLATELGLTEPVLQQGPTLSGAQNAAELEALRAEHERLASTHVEALIEHRKAICAKSVGRKLWVSEAAFTAARACMKEALDAACEWRQPGQPPSIPQACQPKVLRLYHAFIQSKAVAANDVPGAA